VVRGVVLPAALALLGERAWYLPAWLRWLPGRSLACEGMPPPAAGWGAAGQRTLPRPLLPGTAVPEPSGS
jgi:hypothetical protein